MPPKAASSSDAGAASKPTGTWDNVDFLRELLVAFYQVGNNSFNPQVNTAIVEYLAAQGYETSWSAIRQHVQKLRKNRDTAGIVAASESGVSTPRKSATPTPRKRRSAKKEVDDADDAMNLKLEQHEDEEMGSPCERPRKRGKSLLSAQINNMDNETKLEDEDGY
ncbi:hypothetical protein HDV57DRAFT_485602 [Trichoderma longibrachiatum]